MKRKLLIIGPTPPPYHGVAVATEMLLQSELARAFEVSLVDTADRRGIANVYKPDAYDVVLFVKEWLSLAKIVFTERPHLAYLPISQSTLGILRDSLFFWLAYLSGCRLVIHLHGGNLRTWYEAQGKPVKAYVSAFLRRTERIVVLGDSLRPIFDGLADAERVAVVSNGIDWPRQYVKDYERPRLDARFRVLHVGTLNRAKGTLALLAAVPQVLRAEGNRAEFVIAGEWSNREDRDEAMAFVREHGLSAAVTFSGPVSGEQKQRLYASADLFVFAGIQQEGQPLVVLEAMAAGLPVLYSDRGCLRETVIEGVTGLEVRANDAEDVARRIVWMMDNQPGREEMGRNARKRYEALYTKERFIKDMVSVFDSAGGESTASTA
ncbi:glycosyltransferase family 4 protein [Methylocaldum gracile subsp. desertum]|uniref:glycosyltransferase family 4 protein n=1 Tax=Methylocaldum sp. GT1BW TaxID=3438964 RepID=UPI003DA02F4F